MPIAHFERKIQELNFSFISEKGTSGVLLTQNYESLSKAISAPDILFALETAKNKFQKAVKEKPLAQAVEEIRSEAQWVPLKQVPELYKKAVLAVEDHRYYTHHGIDWISMARAVVHDIRVMKPEQGRTRNSSPQAIP